MCGEQDRMVSGCYVTTEKAAEYQDISLSNVHIKELSLPVALIDNYQALVINITF